VTFSFAVSGAELDGHFGRGGARAAAALYRGAAGAGCPGPGRLPDRLCRARGRSGRTDGWSALHARLDEDSCKTLELPTEFVTLHVGAGTFLPVKAEDTADHKMHAEWGEVSAEMCGAAARRRGQGAAGYRRGHHEFAFAGSPVSKRFPAPPTSSSRRATASGRWTGCHQFPPAAFDAVHAGVGLRRAGADEGGLRPRHAGGYRFYSYGDASLLWPAA
jgi:hypothetical protein